MTQEIMITVGRSTLADRRRYYAADLISYQHSSQAIGGFWSCRFEVSITPDEISDWLARSLGAPVVVYGAAGGRAWEGFVNRVKICFRGLELVRGPFLDIANRVYVAYTTPSYTVAGVTFGGNQKQTALGQDSFSQDRWGQHERVVSGGTLTDTQATNLRDTYLAEMKDPKLDRRFSPGCGAELKVLVECGGWIKIAQNYIYDDQTTGDVNLSAKIDNVVGEEPNGYWGDRLIAENTLQVENSEDDKPDAWAVLNKLNELGTPNAERALFGMFEHRRFHYVVEEYGGAYQLRLSNPNVVYEKGSGERLDPWFVKPGRWVFISDFQTWPDRSEGDRRSDPAWFFIEEVTYSYPYNLNFSGGYFGRLQQLMKQVRR